MFSNPFAYFFNFVSPLIQLFLKVGTGTVQRQQTSVESIDIFKQSGWPFFFLKGWKWNGMEMENVRPGSLLIQLCCQYGVL